MYPAEDLAIAIRCVCNPLPFRVGDESSPGGIGRFLTGMLEYVDQGVVRFFRIRGRPVANHFHAMLVENARRVIAKPGVEIIEISWRCRIGTQLEYLLALGGNLGEESGAKSYGESEKRDDGVLE